MNDQGGADSDALEQLAQRFAHVPRDLINRMLREAAHTIERLTGKPDPLMAADLAELRIQIRLQAYPAR